MAILSTLRGIECLICINGHPELHDTSKQINGPAADETVIKYILVPGEGEGGEEDAGGEGGGGEAG